MVNRRQVHQVEVHIVKVVKLNVTAADRPINFVSGSGK